MPYLGSTLFITVMVVGLCLGMAGTMVLVRALWPGWLGRVETMWERRPGRSLALGLPAVVVAVVVLGGLSEAAAGPLKLAAAIGLGGVLGLALTGASGLAGVVGRRLPRPEDAAAPWRAALRGIIVLELAFVLPLLGWLVVLPVALCGGFGAALLGLRRGGPPARERTVTAPQSLVTQPAREGHTGDAPRVDPA